MQSNELTAVLEKTKEIAIWPVNVEQEVPYQVKYRNRNRQYCPTGCVKATIIENGHAWIEKRTIAICGDTDYEIKRRNGVLVEIDGDENKDRVNWDAIKKDRHAKILMRNSKKIIQLVTSRQACVAAWDEYALIQAQREKEEIENQAAYNRLAVAQAELMGFPGELRWYDDPKKRNAFGAMSTGYHTLDYDWVTSKYIEKAHHRKVGRIGIDLGVAEKIISLLTPEQKKKIRRYALDRVRDNRR